jgi:hypothetical protein
VSAPLLDCRHCGEYLQGDAATLGARCPHCREPLYERPDGIRRQRDALESRGDVCGVHPGNVAVGPCKRCGTFMCGICRSRWEDRVLCLACVERLMRNKEAAPEHIKTHRWQAAVSVLLGFASWILAFLALPLAGLRNAAAPNEVIVVMLILAVISLLPALFGLGQAAAAIRVRGDRMVLATCGLALTGAQLGTVTGLMLLVIWKQ